MTSSDEQIQKQSNSARAGVVGAAIGAAVGSAATVILIDKKKRTQAVSAIKTAGRKALNAADSFKAKTEDLEEATNEVKTGAQKILEDGKDAIKKTRKHIL